MLIFFLQALCCRLCIHISNMKPMFLMDWLCATLFFFYKVLIKVVHNVISSSSLYQHYSVTEDQIFFFYTSREKSWLSNRSEQPNICIFTCDFFFCRICQLWLFLQYSCHVMQCFLLLLSVHIMNSEWGVFWRQGTHRSFKKASTKSRLMW